MSLEDEFKEAVLAGDLELARLCLEEGVSPETAINAKRSRQKPNSDTSAEGFTAMHVAAYEDDVDLFALMLEHGGDPWAKTRFGSVPIVLAATWSSPSFVRAFIDAGLDLDATNARPVVAAAGQGNRTIVELLLAGGATNGLGIAMRSSCSFNGDPQILTAILDAGGVTPPSTPQDDWTPRIYALGRKHDECLRILAERTEPLTLIDAAIDGNIGLVASFLANGANVNELVRHDIGPLVGAASRGHLDVVRVLLNAGAEVNRRSIHGTAISCALSANHIAVAELLHDRGAKFDDPRYGSVLHAMINRGVASETYEWLAKRYKPERPDSHLATAAFGGDMTAAKALLSMGANINGADTWMRSPLTRAAFANRVPMVKWLLEHGADAKARDPHGRSILHYLLTYDDYSEDWCDADFDESRYDRAASILKSESVLLLLEAGAKLPW